MTQYIERREKFIGEFINNVKTEYRNSPDFTAMIDGRHGFIKRTITAPATDTGQ